MHDPVLAILAAVFAAFVLATLVAGGLVRAGFPLPPAERRIGCVDGLRGYLALCVMAHHFIIWLRIAKLHGGWEAPDVKLFNQFGAGGVGLFFMTTGLVFYPRIRAGFRACDWRAVYLSRLFRLTPAVMLAVALVMALIMARTGLHPTPRDILPALSWIAAWAEPPLLGYPDSGRLNAYVLWSLHQEWIFYLAILPACAAVADLLRRFGQPLWLIPLALLGVALLARALAPSATPPVYLPSFAMGMLAYECRAHPRLSSWLRGPRATLAATLSLLAGMTLFAQPYGAALPLFGFFFACVACGNDFGGVLRTRGALALGECSYSIYLLHGLALALLYVDLDAAVGPLSAAQMTLLLPPAALVVTLVAAASFLLVERPAIRLGAILARRKPRGSAAIPQVTT
ncbi:peptidoglycan/LPS O-acetylase OafA/YrhL [Rhodoblastus acidophilus]|uniref:acyltransferase family protein n=1 Tax=Rhodoblastus acidophilus TaxID=1074 RepID=UPI002224CA40|nr:acyltransferase family protein [Rhodoblastus acidophilus]MCW2318229.1 peptidoglycan/LPS O-acetylase OafA/YrhL [Rhodoblastus acidophilus]